MRYPTLAAWAQAKENDQHSKVRELLPRLDWHALWEAEDEEEWLLYPLIPARRLIALFSAAKVGKSLLMLEIAAALSTGKKVLDYGPTQRNRVLYIDFENDPRGDVRTRLQDMGYEPGELDYLDYLSFPSLSYLDSAIGASELLAAVEAYGPALVIIDTISRAVGGEENDNDTWLNFYKHTGLMLKQQRVALIRLDHSGKDEGKGQRGGSAKSGDVDAIWKLTVVAKERFRLECTSSRFPLETKELTLIRHDDPLLHHTVEDRGAGGGDREAKILQLIELANRDGLPTDTSGAKLIEWAKQRGLRYRKDGVHEEAARRRKSPPRLLFDPHPPKDPGVDPSTNGNSGHFERKTPPPAAGGEVGGAPGPTPPPLSLSIREGAGEGVNGQVCEECGWDRFHKAACSKNPYKREEVD